MNDADCAVHGVGDCLETVFRCAIRYCQDEHKAPAHLLSREAQGERAIFPAADAGSVAEEADIGVYGNVGPWHGQLAPDRCDRKASVHLIKPCQSARPHPWKAVVICCDLVSEPDS